MGRPRKDSRSKRTIDAGRLLLSPDEHAEITSRAKDSGLKIIDYMRSAAVKAQIVNRKDWQRRTFLLSNLTNNLNQIARWANTHKGSADHREVIIALLRLERAVRRAEGLHDQDQEAAAL